MTDPPGNTKVPSRISGKTGPRRYTGTLLSVSAAGAGKGAGRGVTPLMAKG